MGNDGRSAPERLRVLHNLEREIISQQQQAAETRRQAGKVKAAAADAETRCAAAKELEQNVVFKTRCDLEAAGKQWDSAPSLQVRAFMFVNFLPN